MGYAAARKYKTSKLDTLGMYDDLKQSGAPDDLSRAITTAVANSFEQADIASKADFDALEYKIDAKIERTRTELKEDIHALDKKIDGVANDLALTNKDLGFVKKEISKITWLIGVVITGVAAQVLNMFFKFV